MRVIEKTIDIHAPADVVWEIITNFSEYPEWNPFMLRAKGNIEVGQVIEVQFQPPGGKETTFRPTILIVQAPIHLQWLGKLAFPGLFSGKHEFIITPQEGGVRVNHREEFTGALVPLLGATLKRTEEGFTEFNAALKERAESRT